MGNNAQRRAIAKEVVDRVIKVHPQKGDILMIHLNESMDRNVMQGLADRVAASLRGHGIENPVFIGQGEDFTISVIAESILSEEKAKLAAPKPLPEDHPIWDGTGYDPNCPHPEVHNPENDPCQWCGGSRVA